jgi:hypothetical protein
MDDWEQTTPGSSKSAYLFVTVPINPKLSIVDCVIPSVGRGITIVAGGFLSFLANYLFQLCGVLASLHLNTHVTYNLWGKR